MFPLCVNSLNKLMFGFKVNWSTTSNKCLRVWCDKVLIFFQYHNENVVLSQQALTCKSRARLYDSIHIIIIMTFYYFLYSVTGFLMRRNWLGMQQGNGAKTLVETWPPLIRDMQKVCQKIFSFSCLCTSNTHMQFILTLLL